MRLTHARVQVALALAEGLFDRHWGYELSKRAHVRSGVLYPILQDWLDEGWLEDDWEDLSEVRAKRPPRRYYTLTDKGRRHIGALLDRARDDLRFAALYQWAGGST